MTEHESPSASVTHGVTQVVKSPYRFIIDVDITSPENEYIKWYVRRPLVTSLLVISNTVNHEKAD